MFFLGIRARKGSCGLIAAASFSLLPHTHCPLPAALLLVSRCVDLSIVLQPSSLLLSLYPPSLSLSLCVCACVHAGVHSVFVWRPGISADCNSIALHLMF